MALNETESRRWTHFSSALELAIQLASRKWTWVTHLFYAVPSSSSAYRYDDFCECFSIWCEEHPEGGMGMYNLVKEHMESAIQVRV